MSAARRVARTVRRLPGAALAARVLRRVRSAARGPLPGDGLGLVEELGPDRLRGWVAVPETAPPLRVAVFVGETEVMGTWAADRTSRLPRGRVRGFSLGTRHLWRYCSRRDRVSVRVDGVPLPIVGHGLWLTPEQDGPHDLAALQQQRDGGMVFGRTGRLQRSKALDTEWQRRVLALYDRTGEVLQAELGTDLFLLYGTLLGAVREGTFIGHDNDFDCGYVSRCTHPREAARELQQLALRLVDAGLDVDAHARLLHVHDPDERRYRIDLFHLYFDRRGVLRFPFGAAGTRRLRRPEWRGVRPAELAGAPVLVPADAEEFVEVLYGPGWRQPVPGFDWERERRQDAPAARLPRAGREEVYWANFYARHDFGSGSTFAEHVLSRPGLPDAVVDLGCGQGRDSFAFATAGRRVTGVDRSHVGIRHAAEKAREMGLADRLAFTACDVSDLPALAAVLGAARERAAGGPLLFYARFFLHSVPEHVQESLLEVVRERARAGDWFAAEFRTVGDAAARKVHEAHYRRFQDGPAFGRRLAAVHGWDVVDEVEGTGLSPYCGEDPVLYRVLARRP